MEKSSTNSDLIVPHEEVVKNANVNEYEKLYEYSIKNREKFWAEQAETLEWFKKWEQVLDESKKPFYKWFVNKMGR